MAESKTQGRASGAAKPRKGPAKPREEAAKPARRAAKSAKPAAAKSTRQPAAKSGAKSAAKTAGQAAAKSRTPRAPARRKLVQDTARSYFDALAARDSAAAAAHWHREGVHESVPLGIFRGPEAVRRLYEETFDAMPDMTIAVERITADDRVAAVQWRASGTFDGGSFRGVEATGRLVELRGVDCLEVVDGKIVRATSVYDGAALARGMGLLPAEESAAERALRSGVNTVTKLRRVVAGRTGGAR